MSAWDDQALRARIKSAGKERYAAGSPNPSETAVYGSLLQRTLRGRAKQSRVLILGMTPELRILAAGTSCRTICVDINLRSIELYRDWLSAKQRRDETIIHGDWLELPNLLDDPVDAIMGDGLFGNLHTIEDHRLLLNNMIRCLAPDGAVIQRNIMIPRSLRPIDHDARALLRALRAGEINEEEFGFGMRIWGCFNDAYNAETLLLDNQQVFKKYKAWVDEGILSPREYELIHRFYFAGKNLLPTQDLWEQLLTEAGFYFDRQRLTGQTWYLYYPIYYCRPIRSRGIDDA